MSKKWSEDEDRWLRENLGRMDLQSLSHALGFPLEEVEKHVKALKAAEHHPHTKKAPASVKEAVREISAARRDYEKAMDLFHKRHFEDAARHFEDLIEKHPDEKEFVDRARVYLQASRNGAKTRTSAPSEPEEIFHAAVYEKNRGNVDRALELLRRSEGNGRVHYLAACCHALAGDADQAITNLRKAIAADSQNRIHARLESDLASIRNSPGFHELVVGA